MLLTSVSPMKQFIGVVYQIAFVQFQDLTPFTDTRAGRRRWRLEMRDRRLPKLDSSRKKEIGLRATCAAAARSPSHEDGDERFGGRFYERGRAVNGVFFGFNWFLGRMRKIMDAASGGRGASKPLLKYIWIEFPGRKSRKHEEKYVESKTKEDTDRYSIHNRHKKQA